MPTIVWQTDEVVVWSTVGYAPTRVHTD